MELRFSLLLLSLIFSSCLHPTFARGGQRAFLPSASHSLGIQQNEHAKSCCEPCEGVHGRIFSSDGGRPLPGSITVKAGRKFADYHRLLSPSGKVEVVASMPGYKSKSTSIWLGEAGTTLDFVLDPEVTFMGNLLRSGCECDCGYKSWLGHLEVSLILFVIVGFLCFLFRGRIKNNLSKQKQLVGPKRPVVV